DTAVMATKVDSVSARVRNNSPKTIRRRLRALCRKEGWKPTRGFVLIVSASQINQPRQNRPRCRRAFGATWANRLKNMGKFVIRLNETLTLCRPGAIFATCVARDTPSGASPKPGHRPARPRLEPLRHGLLDFPACAGITMESDARSPRTPHAATIAAASGCVSIAT